MHVAQSGIFAPRDGLALLLLEQAEPGALVQAIANLREPRTMAGVVIFLVSFGLHQRYQWGQWRCLEENLAALLPGQEQGDAPSPEFAGSTRKIIVRVPEAVHLGKTKAWSCHRAPCRA